MGGDGACDVLGLNNGSRNRTVPETLPVQHEM